MPRHVDTTIQAKSTLPVPKVYVRYLVVLYYEHALILARVPCHRVCVGGGDIVPLDR